MLNELSKHVQMCWFTCLELFVHFYIEINKYLLTKLLNINECFMLPMRCPTQVVHLKKKKKIDSHVDKKRELILIYT
jgi:hypothetical protein